jgi:hypothetical protein
MMQPWLRSATRILKNHSPAILSGLAVAGVIGTVVLAVKATPDAQNEITKAATDKSEQGEPLAELTNLEIVTAAWRCYVPAALVGGATIACVIGANLAGARQKTALIGAYTLADTALRNYKDEVLKQFGPNKEQKVVDEIQRRRLDETPVSSAQVIVTGGGDDLCWDAATGRYFRSDIEKIRQAANEFNAYILRDLYASLNEFYRLLDLAPVALGDELGFNVDRLLELQFTSILADNGKPCLAIEFQRLPFREYDKL